MVTFTDPAVITIDWFDSTGKSPHIQRCAGFFFFQRSGKSESADNCFLFGQQRRKHILGDADFRQGLAPLDVLEFQIGQAAATQSGNFGAAGKGLPIAPT